MEKSVRLIRRYAWLIDQLRDNEKLSFSEINRSWQNNQDLRREEDEDKIPERTFHRHRQGILELFGVEIVCDRSNNTYSIANPEVLTETTFSPWLFNRLVLDSKLVGEKDLSGRIMFESSPYGNRWLSTILSAMMESIRMEVSYRRFGEVETKLRKLEPYGVKQSKRRWYLLAKDLERESLSVFALDRISRVEVLKEEPFQFDQAVNIRAFFDEVIGVNLDDDYDCEEIKIRVYGQQRYYIDALPLHQSQEEIKPKENERKKQVPDEQPYTDYKLRLRPEYELQRELLRLGPDVEVLSPKWLREEIRSLAERTAQLYAK